VDNTFATPFAVRPYALGADVVVESATKFLSGHSDLIAGAVMSDVDTIREVQRRVVTFGGCLDPAAAYLLWRGLQTFDVRLARQTSSAARLAEALAARDDVIRVVHPGRADHPQHDLAAEMMPRGTAMLTLQLAGGDPRALAVLRELRLFTEATSLGGVESLASTPFNSSHFSLSAADRTAAGIGPGTLRLSVGLEDPNALLADLVAALDATTEDR
jgi:cystathionine beta-lyase/cystathionine gamma-synthase